MNTAAVLRFERGRLCDADGERAAWPRFAVLGRPIAHSLSPALHAAALRSTGQPGEYRAIEVAPAALKSTLEIALANGVEGLNLTVPLKVEALAHCARRSDEVEEVGAANTLIARETGWHAHNTDVRGLALALERARGPEWTRRVRRADVVGSGGAARAAVACLLGLGAREVNVWARRPQAAEWARRRGARVRALDADAWRGCDVLVQCTSLGLRRGDPSPVSLTSLDARTFAVDLVYGDHPTAFLREAASRGCATMDGRPMLVAQAALSFGMWTGEDPPLEAMAAALGWRWTGGETDFPTSREAN